MNSLASKNNLLSETGFNNTKRGAMEQELSFEILLKKHCIAVERYINFRLPNSFEADDVIQETYCAAYIGYEKLRKKELFKPWILSIAKNQCNIWLRKKYCRELIPLDNILETAAISSYDEDATTEIILKRRFAQQINIYFFTIHYYFLPKIPYTPN